MHGLCIFLILKLSTSNLVAYEPSTLIHKDTKFTTSFQLHNSQNSIVQETYNERQVRNRNCEFSGDTFAECTSDGQGGALFLDSNSPLAATLETCQFTNCKAGKTEGHQYSGGAIGTSSIEISLNLTGCSIETCSASYFGGAIYSLGNLNLAQSNITACSTTGEQSCGGAVYVESARDYMIFTECYFQNNSASQSSAGAIYFASTSVKVEIRSTQFIKNTASSLSGAIAFLSNTKRSSATISGCSFSNNKVRRDSSTDANDMYFSDEWASRDFCPSVEKTSSSSDMPQVVVEKRGDFYVSNFTSVLRIAPLPFGIGPTLALVFSSFIVVAMFAGVMYWCWRRGCCAYSANAPFNKTIGAAPGTAIVDETGGMGVGSSRAVPSGAVEGGSFQQNEGQSLLSGGLKAPASLD